MPASWDGAPETWANDTIMTMALLNTRLRDRFLWLKTRPYSSTTVTVTNTTSTSFVAMSGASVSLTSVGGVVWIWFIGAISNSATANNRFDIAIDGTRVGDATLGLTEKITINASDNDAIALLWITTASPPAAGSHTYTVRWHTSSGTLTGLGRMFAQEIF